MRPRHARGKSWTDTRHTQGRARSKACGNTDRLARRKHARAIDLRPDIMQRQSVDQGEKGGAKPTSTVVHIPSNQPFHIRSFCAGSSRRPMARSNIFFLATRVAAARPMPPGVCIASPAHPRKHLRAADIGTTSEIAPYCCALSGKLPSLPHVPHFVEQNASSAHDDGLQPSVATPRVCREVKSRVSLIVALELSRPAETCHSLPRWQGDRRKAAIALIAAFSLDASKIFTLERKGRKVANHQGQTGSLARTKNTLQEDIRASCASSSKKGDQGSRIACHNSVFHPCQRQITDQLLVFEFARLIHLREAVPGFWGRFATVGTERGTMYTYIYTPFCDAPPQQRIQFFALCRLFWIGVVVLSRQRNKKRSTPAA